MGKRARRERREEAEFRLHLLLSQANGVNIKILHRSSPIHVRVCGEVTVDYWPSTNRAWLYGSSQKGFGAEPEEVLRIARGLPHNEDARTHIEDLLSGLI